jgi:hypothetical protein
MTLKNALVNRSWVTYEVARDGHITTVLHVEPVAEIPSDGPDEALLDAVRDYMRRHTNIDRADIRSRVRMPAAS